MNNNITRKNRIDSYIMILKAAKRRRELILLLLWQYGKMTAQEISTLLYQKGVTPSEDRNYASPRLTELKQAGKVVAVGKKICRKTGRNVTVWQLTPAGKD